jgi:hypothetical protein
MADKTEDRFRAHVSAEALAKVEARFLQFEWIRCGGRSPTRCGENLVKPVAPRAARAPYRDGPHRSEKG